MEFNIGLIVGALITNVVWWFNGSRQRNGLK